MRHKRAALIVASILLLPVVLVVVGMLLMQTHWFSQYVSDRLSEQWGRQVQWRHPLTIKWSLRPTFAADDLLLADSEWSDREHMLTADRITMRITLLRLLRGVMDIEHVQVSRAELHLESSAGHGNNWDPFLPKEEPDEPGLDVRLGAFILERALVTYTAIKGQTHIRVDADNQSGRSLRVKAEGEIRGEPFIASITGDPEAAEIDTSTTGVSDVKYRLKAGAHWRDHQLEIEGWTHSLLRLTATVLSTSMDGPDIGQIPASPDPAGDGVPYELHARVDYNGGREITSEHRGIIGKSEFRGSLGFDGGGGTPKWQAHMQISEIDLNAFAMLVPNTSSDDTGLNNNGAKKNWSDRLGNQLDRLRTFDAQVRLEIGQLQKDDVIVQQLHFESRLLDAKLEQSIGMVLGGGNLLWTAELNGAGDDPLGGLATLEIEDVNLGKALEPIGLSALGSLDGELGLALRNNMLTVRNSHIHYSQPANNSDIVFRLANHGNGGKSEGVHIDANGQFDGKDFSFALASGPLLDLGTPTDSYPVDGQLDVSDNSLSIKGTLQQPILLAGMDMDISIIGNSPEDLASLPFGYLHQLSPFSVSANLVNQEDSWGIRNLKAEVGDSDLSGKIRVTRRGDRRPLIDVKLMSDKLDIVPLLPLTAERRRETTDQNESGAGDNVLPENDLFHQRLKVADARIEYVAREVHAAGVPLKEVRLQLRLNDGQLALEPIEVALGSGTIRISADVDATDDPSKGSADIQVSRIGLGDALKRLKVSGDTKGLIGGEGKFRFSGASFADVLASLDGSMELVMTDGQLDADLIAAGGLDLGELLNHLFGDEEAVDIRCAYARLVADNGQLVIEPMLIITSQRNIVGDGHVNFNDETVKFEVEAKAKDFSLLSAANPVRIEGKFDNLKLDVLSDELVARGVLAAAGGAIFPPAALLGFVETGDEDEEVENGCRKAVAEADVAPNKTEAE